VLFWLFLGFWSNFFCFLLPLGSSYFFALLYTFASEFFFIFCVIICGMSVVGEV